MSVFSDASQQQLSLKGINIRKVTVILIGLEILFCEPVLFHPLILFLSGNSVFNRKPSLLFIRIFRCNAIE